MSAITRHLHAAQAHEPWAREFAAAIELPAQARTLILSGVGPEVSNPAAPAGTVAAYGDTRTQTASVLAQINTLLQSHGYGLGDIVSMQALMAADPAQGGRPDYEAFSEVYNTYFGTTPQPHVPTRTRAQVLGFVPPGWLVEVTVTAAKA